MENKVTLGLLSVICLVIAVESNSSTKNYAYAIVESCSGCSLNRLPDVKRFIFDDLPNYERVEFANKHGAVPELVIFDKNSEELERLPLSKLSREECNELLEYKGFKRSGRPKDEI